MFIRRTATRNRTSGDAYVTFRLVRTERIEGKVRQITLLNLGRHFAVPPEDWPLLCARLEQLISPQGDFLPLELPPALEQQAQRYKALLVAHAPAEDTATASAPMFEMVDIQSLELTQPRSVGVEYVALEAMAALGFEAFLKTLGLNGVTCSAIVGQVVARMAAPGSELSTWGWLRRSSALGELLDVDFETLSLMRLYRSSDALVKHREAIESYLFGQLSTVFGLQETVTLYDLTNTYFEGEVAGNGQAAYGRSKEKRSDCKLVTLGLVLDGSGFVRRSRVFEGNAVEARTVESMLQGLGAPAGALVVMDAGIATKATIAWLVEQGYRYLVVSRSSTRHAVGEEALTVETAQGQSIQVRKELSEDGKEVRLYCHSPGRERKESAMNRKSAQRFEQGLQKLADSLAKPRGEKRFDKVNQRLGRLKEKSRGASRHYEITLTADESGKQATALTWKAAPLDGTRWTEPGTYCLASNETQWDEARLWSTYTMLTDLEAVFRSLKSELGLRPVYHHSAHRTEGHLFISVLAYQFVQYQRTRLKAKNIHTRWDGLREILSIQRRVTADFRQSNGRTLHVRKATTPEPELKALYDALGLAPLPGGTRKLIG